MNENDTILIRELSDSYRHQLGFYTTLGETVHRILSRLILSRGDFSGVKGDFAEKQRLLECIDSERGKTSGSIKVWQERKSFIADHEAAKELDRVLREIESAIKKFLDGEEQLKRYLEQMIRKGS
jgi:hypothetical protein